MFATGFEPWHILVLMSFPALAAVIAFAVVMASRRRRATPPPGLDPPAYDMPLYDASGRPVYPPYGGAAARTNGFAIASLVLGILWLSWIGSVLALVFGYLARSQISRTREGGAGLALAGIILGWIGVATFLLLILFGLAVVSGSGSSGP
jgi:hypothetical protein